MNQQKIAAREAQKQAEVFNRLVQVGGEIDYVESPGAPVQRHRTRSEASVLSGHTAVVWLEGKAGCVAVSHCRASGGEERPSP